MAEERREVAAAGGAARARGRSREVDGVRAEKLRRPVTELRIRGRSREGERKLGWRVKESWWSSVRWSLEAAAMAAGQRGTGGAWLLGGLQVARGE